MPDLNQPKLSRESSGAFCPDANQIALSGASEGPLVGLSFAAKDVFDIAGVTAGNGHPDWLRTHAPASRTAPAVQRMLDAGADLAGKTIADELCYSLTGENYHYGTPVNAHDPARVPGGSSSGSASATAAGLVDFALGTDCGGSVRVPASYCGLYGMRPTHGAVPTAGVVPFAPSLDCVGWFARDPGTFARVGALLLPDDAPAEPVTHLLLAEDAFALLDPALRPAFAASIEQVEAAVAPATPVTLSEEGLDQWSETFRTVQAGEIWASLGDWIEAVKPRFGPGVSERFAAAKLLNPGAIAAAKERRLAIRGRLDALLSPGTAIITPTVPRIAPLRNLAAAEVEVAYRHAAMNLLCCAGLAGLPQVSLPLATFEGMPIGLSLLGPRGSDRALLALAASLAPATA
ncbi:amidase [Aurantimonas aggregata]|uniref:Amidase n=1 Tax=Aurantimonas aggregata TaxID=2047720 RepID=A0A6L9MG79_9HYPH|nr:amidase [Aurantimonas aggregata]NDV86530.1 amidase [Aurantimonas aggregata]